VPESAEAELGSATLKALMKLRTATPTALGRIRMRIQRPHTVSIVTNA
jgi:hypothetical protein